MTIIELGHGYFARSSRQGLALCRPPAEGETRADLDPWCQATDLAQARRLVAEDRALDGFKAAREAKAPAGWESV
jgi:hypothetical protein